MGAIASRNVITVVLPTMDDVLGAIPGGLDTEEPEFRARLRLALLNTQVSADADDLEAAIEVLRARAAGDAVEEAVEERERLAVGRVAEVALLCVACAAVAVFELAEKQHLELEALARGDLHGESLSG